MKEFTTYAQAAEYVRDNETKLRKMHHDQDLTARETAAQLKITHCPNWVKALFQVLGGKGYPHGGERKNSGMPKGTQLCGKCRRKQGTCNCSPA